MSYQVLKTDQAPAAIGPYSQGIMTEHFVFVSGQIPVNPETGTMPDTIVEQTKQVMQNIAAILSEGNLTLDDVVKSTIFLTDMDDFVVVNGVYKTFFAETPPARSTVAVSALPKQAKVEIEVSQQDVNIL